jgi:hypothetical protein
MKTTLIHIDPHDDLTSIKDKMTWSKSQRLLLFFPSGYPLQQANLAMKLILRYAYAQGAQLAIVTRDRVLRSIAEEVGIPCFASAPLAEKSKWRADDDQQSIRLPKGAEAILRLKDSIPDSRQTGNASNFQKLLTLVLLVVVILLISVFFLPSAIIEISPVSELQEITYEVTAGVNFPTVDSSGKLPASELIREISGFLTKASTGSVDLPIANASGSVEIANISEQDIFIPAGSRLVSNSETQIDFELLDDVNLLLTSKDTVIASIKAIEPGSAGNVPAGETFIIAGYENLIQIQTATAILGGKDQTLPAPSEADYLELEERLTENLLTQCKDLIKDLVQTDQVLIPDSIRLGEVSNTDESPQVGEPSDSASLAISIECKGLVIQKSDDLQLAVRILDQNLPKAKVALNDVVEIVPLGKANTDDGEQFTWRLKVSRQISPMWNSEELVAMLLGKRTDEAKEILAKAVLQKKTASIVINPGWWKRLPLLPYQLDIRVLSQ